MPAVREKSVDQAKPMITSDSDRMASRPTSQTTCSRRESFVELIGEGQADRDADRRDERREEEREAEPLGEESGEEARVIVEDEVRLVERALHAAEEADRQHDAERHDEEDGEHQRREEHRQRTSAKLLAAAPHGFSTTQSSGLISTPTSAPSRSVGPVARGGDRDDLAVAAGDIGLDAGAEVAHEAHAARGSTRRAGIDQRGCPPAAPKRPRPPAGMARPGIEPPGTDAPRPSRCRRQNVGRADEGGDEGVARPPVDLERRAGLPDAALAHDHDRGRPWSSPRAGRG